MARYVAIIEQDGLEYSVWFPDFSGCFSAGTTWGEATRMAEEALAAHVDLMR